MLSSAELVLWAIHHATTLLFGVFASAALCGVEINGRHSLELVGVGAATGCAFGLANAVGGELFARQAYPLVVHLPLVVYLCVRYRLSPLLVMLGVTSAYLSCQFSNWMGIAALAATDSQIAYYAARIITTLGVFAVLLHWASDIGPRLAIKSPTELEILLILPLVYYIFDYATNVYTTLFHSGSVVTVEFLAFTLCAFYLMFLAVYLREYEAKEIAERERWMLATRDSAAIKELEAWRQSGRELSVLRHDMRHYLRGLAALIEEGHTDEALERIDALCETNDRTAVRRYCANETVNIALSSLSADINAHGITADLHAAVPETVHVGDVDLFSVVSNALDNAIAAASAAPEGKRFVDLDLRYEDGQLLLLVSNTFGRAPHMVDGMPVAQHTGHGFGTKSIMLAVERMNGNCQFRINGDRFELRAVMQGLPPTSLQRCSRRGQLLNVGPHALLGGLVGERRLKTVERQHAAPLHMGDQAGLEHGGVKVINCHKHIGIGLAHDIGRTVVQQQHRLGVQGLQRLAEQVARQGLARRDRSVARAGDACQHTKILGGISDGTERLAQRGAIRAGGQLAARALGFIQIAFDQHNRRARVARDTHTAICKRRELLLGRLSDGFFFLAL